MQTAQPATEPTKAEKPKPAKPASKRRTGPPESFALTEELLTWAEGVGLNRTRAATETERWLDYHRGKGNVMADWTAAWRTWMRRAVEYGRERPNGSSAHGAPPSRGSAVPGRQISQEARDSWANWGKKTT